MGDERIDNCLTQINKASCVDIVQVFIEELPRDPQET